MADLRKEAKGRECQVRLPGICNHNPATTVLAHYRLFGTCGMRMKPNNLQGAWACSSCQDEIDRRIPRNEGNFVCLAHTEDILRILNILLKKGRIKI